MEKACILFIGIFHNIMCSLLTFFGKKHPRPCPLDFHQCAEMSNFSKLFSDVDVWLFCFFDRFSFDYFPNPQRRLVDGKSPLILRHLSRSIISEFLFTLISFSKASLSHVGHTVNKKFLHLIILRNFDFVLFNIIHVFLLLSRFD